MKKLLLILLSIIISISTVLFCVGNIYSATAEKSSINSFIEEGVNLIRENDAGKEFVPEVVIDDETNDEKSSDSLLKKYAVGLTETDNTSIENEGFSDTAFQTCRLIVKASKTPDNLNSIGMANGFKDWYIIQFETEEDTQAAYEEYLSEEYVLSVSPDMVVDLSLDTENEGEPLEFDTDETPTRLDSWGSIITGLYDVKDYIDSHPEFDREIVIGVVDTGVDTDNEFIKDRLIRTYFNSSSEGEEENEYQEYAHGTMVCSVIKDNTPDNVKFKVYKTGNEMPTSALTLALIRSIEDDVDIINCSFTTWIDCEIIEDALNCCFENDILVVASAGNDNVSLLRVLDLPASDERVITVAANEFYCIPTDYTSFGQVVDLMAPGDDIPVSFGKDTFTEVSGTSFSSPMTVSLFVDLMILFPSYLNEQIERIVYSNADSSDIFYDCSLFGYGIIDAIGSAGFKRNTEPKFSLPEGKYIDEIEVEITAEQGCEIYYTLDGSYPSKESGILYTEPVKISDDCPFLKAVAYGNGLYRSECTKTLYRLQRVGTDNMFEISDDGQITAYTGDVYDLIIPEKINGIPVKSIAPEIFSDSELVGVTFPDTMDTVSENAFSNCESLMLADGKSITLIGKEAFYNCGLYIVDFPRVQKIESRAFGGNYPLGGVSFPECKIIGKSVFSGCRSLRMVNLPELESSDGGTFYGCRTLTEVYFPLWSEMGTLEFDEIAYMKMLDLPSAKSINRFTFDPSGQFTMHTYLERLELSNVEEIRSIPYAYYKDFQKPLTMVIPSTFTSFRLNGINTFNTVKPEIFVYGTRETYAEKWASEYENVEFIEITPDTAVIEDLPDEYYDYMRYLFADVVGFNRTYQWYGSYSDSNTGGIPIEGANERKFVPKENEQYPYYYCVVTSTDVGYDSVEIRTGASKYMDYKAETIDPADYSALDNIIATIPNDLSNYSDESVSALNAVLDSIDRNLDATEQDTVDGYVEALTDAITNLKLKEYTVSFIADGETILEYDLEYAKEISMIPPAPAKEGYTFKEWLPDIPETMPAKDISFYAVFEENKQPDNKPIGEIKPLIDICGFEYACTIDYRTTISFTAITKDMPKDATVVWYKDGQKVGEGDKFTVKEAKEAFTVQAKIIDKSGSILNTSETELVKVKTDFLSRIIAFFKALFKRLPVIEQ